MKRLVTGSPIARLPVGKRRRAQGPVAPTPALPLPSRGRRCAACASLNHADAVRCWRCNASVGRQA